PYVATRPDPLTLYIDFRNVTADGLASFVARGKAPRPEVAGKPGDRSAGGSPRVRINLSQPVAHHVRADRNSVVVDFDKAPVKSTANVMAAPKPTSAGTPNNGDDLRALVTANRAAVDPIAALGLNASPGQAQVPVQPAPQQ